MSQSDYNFADFCHDAWAAAKALIAGLVIVLLALLCLLIWQLAIDAAHANQVITDVDRATVITGGAMTDLQKTLALERAAATAQIQATTDTLRQAQATLAALNKTAAKLNAVADGVNGTFGQATSTLQTLNSAVLAQNSNLTTLSVQARSSLQTLDQQTQQLGPLLKQSAAAVRDFDALAADPSNRETLRHIDATMSNVDATTVDIHAWVHRETTPVRGTWHVIKSFLFSFAGPAAQVATAAK